jgi:Zn-dependent protease
VHPSTNLNPASGPQRPASGVLLFGVPVRFHFTFILLLVFLVFFVVSKGQASALVDVLFVICIFASVLLHELGHAVVARRYGIRTLEIVLYPIGGVARLQKNPPPRAELWIALAGPAVNVVIAAVILVALALTRQPVTVGGIMVPTDANVFERIAAINLLLAAFNMLPAFPMDGGRVLRSLLAIWKGEARATEIAAQAGRTLAIMMGLFGLLSGHFMLIFIAFFVYLGATQEGMASAGRSLAEGAPVRAAMITQFHTLPHGSTMRDAAELLLATTQQDFPVMHGDQVIGLLDRTAFLRGMAAQGADAYVSSVMDRDFPRLNPDMDLVEALPVLAEAGPCALVMQNERLEGLLTRENLSEFLLLRRFGMMKPEAKPTAEPA